MHTIGRPVVLALLIVSSVSLWVSHGKSQDGRPSYGRVERSLSSEVDRRRELKPEERRRAEEEAKRKADTNRKIDEALSKPELNRPFEAPRPDAEELWRRSKQVDQTFKDEQRKNDGRANADAKQKVDGVLERIARGVLDPHVNDGAEFQNREGRLPRRGTGYYREYVYRPNGAATPGAERVVIGRGGEAYYTTNHYETFERVK